MNKLLERALAGEMCIRDRYNTIMRAGIDSILPPFVTSGVNDAEMAKLRDGIEEVLSEMIKLDAQEAR